MFLHKSNFIMRALYPDFIWKMPAYKKKIYLTFDDGPIPEITEFVLENLQKYQAKATFFCIGNNIEKHPNIFQKIIKNGHSVGNHTFNHFNGWKTDDNEYLENVKLCGEAISYQLTAISNQTQHSALSTQHSFRPPYGRIKRSQAKALLPDYQIVMWDVLSGDFSQNLSPETVLRKTLQYTEAGSIVLFHDSIKANKNMSFALPRFLEYFSEKGFEFSHL